MKHLRPPFCSGQEETVYLYLDNELPPAKRAAFEAHLTECQTCQALLQENKALFAALSTLEPVAAPAEIVPAVMAHLPAPESLPQLTPAALVTLTLQAIIGGALLFVGLSRLAAAYQLWLPVFSLSTLSNWQSNALQLTQLIDGLMAWGTAYWTQLTNVSILQMPNNVALAIVVALGAAWLAGNALLLKRSKLRAA